MIQHSEKKRLLNLIRSPNLCGHVFRSNISKEYALFSFLIIGEASVNFMVSGRLIKFLQFLIDSQNDTLAVLWFQLLELHSYICAANTYVKIWAHTVVVTFKSLQTSSPRRAKSAAGRDSLTVKQLISNHQGPFSPLSILFSKPQRSRFILFSSSFSLCISLSPDFISLHLYISLPVVLD